MGRKKTVLGQMNTCMMWNHQKLVLIHILFYCIINFSSNAQERIVFSGIQDTFQVHIHEIGVNEIVYQTWPVQDSSQLFRVAKKNLRVIIFTNDSSLIFSRAKSPININFSDQHTMAIKIDPISVLRNNNYVAFEKMLKPGKSIEWGIGLIGWSPMKPIIKYNDFVIDNKGLYLDIGYKLNWISHALQWRNTAPHVLRGFYAKPKLYAIYQQQVCFFTGIKGIEDKLVKDEFKGVSVMTCFGKQFVFKNRICLDFELGIGYGVLQRRRLSPGLSSIYDNLWPFSEIAYLDSDTYDNLMVSGGIRIGYLFHPYQRNKQYWK